MALATYGELVTEMTSFLDRAGDTDFAARVPTFIALAEARLNRLLDDPEMEVRSTATATGQYTTLPTDFKRLIGVMAGTNRLRQVSGAEITAFDQTNTGAPRAFAISDGAITFAPISTTAAITILYVRRIPPLTAIAPTNWLLTLAPDLYLYGSLLHAEFYGANDERMLLVKSAYDEAIDELRRDGQERKWGASPLAPRLGRT